MTTNTDEMPVSFKVTWDSKFRCDYCMNQKIFTISTMLTHLRECPEAIYGSGKAESMKTARQIANKVITSKKKDKSAYKVSDKAKELERKHRYENDFKNKKPFPVKGREELSGFKFITWLWHPFYYTPNFFNYNDVPSESFMHYRSCVESVAKSGSSILIIRDLRQYIRELQPNNLSKELETKVSSEVLKGVLCIAKKYIKRLTSFKNCLFGKEGKCIKGEKYSNYECSDLNDYPIIVSREQLLKKNFYCGE